MLLNDKVALITGAASGIGRASALKFAREGASVIAVDIAERENAETVRKVQADGGIATAVSADIARAEDVRRMIQAAIRTYGRLDILFNNAGISVSGTVLDMDESTYDKLFAVNVTGVFLGCKEAIPIMVAQGGGVILNTASAQSVRGLVGSVVYPATKGAVLQLTRCLALDHASDGIRVNCVCPGPIETGMFLKTSEELGGLEEARRIFGARIPMGRMGTSEEVAQVAAYLCSEEASFVTGAAIFVDGGVTAR